MKTLLTFVIGLFSVHCFSQQYGLFQPNTVHYFTSQSHHLKGIRIDSVKNSGNEVHYYLHRTPRGSWNFSMPTLDTNGGSWVGKKVIEMPDGITLIPNLWGDTVTIQTQANLNDSWKFYDDTSHYYYQATVTGVDTATILGMLDSVKIITINAYNAFGLNTADSIHGKRIIISKHHGVYQTFALYSFPFPSVYNNDYYMNMTEKENGKIQIFKQTSWFNPTSFQLYDRNAGEEYQYQSYSSSIGSQVSINASYTFLTRTASGNDTLHFTILVKRQERKNGVFQPAYSFNTTSKIVNDTVRWFDASLMPDETGNSFFYRYDYYNTSKCITSPFWSYRSNYISYGVLNNFEPCGKTYDFKIGLGEVEYSQCFDPTLGSGGTMLTYHNKNGVSCGPYVILSTDDHSSLKDYIDLFPIPAKNELQVVSSLENYNLSLYSTSGSLIKQITDINGNTYIDVRDLSDGIYLLKITSNKTRESMIKKIVIEH
ncbi:MAG TPA: T9SS type A sorting domain-containing protein [Flavipsychrobacter sp.]|nr:T9SS type A sorting domain-containing protein [Flavipsychrobacter sp.]